MDTRLRVGIDGRLAVAGARQVNTALDSMRAKSISTTNVMNDRWKLMTGHIFNIRSAVLSLGAGMAATLATSTIVNFEQSMANVAAVSRATKDEMAVLTDTARELGATTKYTAAQAGEGLEFLARAGFNAQRAVKAMPVVLNLAAAANLTLARSAEITANVMAGFQLNAEGASQAADVLATIASRTNTDVSSMAEGMKYVGPIATAVGYSIEETAAALGALSDAGLAGSMAGTGLRRVISSLASPTKEAIKIFKSWGYTVSDFDPRTNSLINIMTKLKAANMDAGQALSIFSDRGGTAAVVLSDMVPKIKYITDALDGSAGAATRMANIMNDTLKGAFLSLQSAIEELFLVAGDDGLKGTLRDLTETMTAFVRHLNGTLDPLDKNAAAVKNLTEVLKALMALAIFVFFTKVTAAFLSFAGAVGTAITAMATAKLGLFAFITPVGAVAAAIAALVTGIVVYRNELLALIGIQTQAKNGMDDMVNVGEAIKLSEWVQPFADAKQKVMDLQKELKNTQKSLDDMNAARNKGIGKFAALYVPGVASKQADTVNALRNRIDSLTDRLGVAKSELQSFVSVVTQGGDVMEHVNGYVDRSTEAIENLGVAIVDTTEEENEAVKAAKKIAESYNVTVRDLQFRIANQRTLTDSLGKGKEAEIQARIEISAREAAESVGILTSDKRYKTLRSLVDILTKEEEKTKNVTQAINEEEEAEKRLQEQKKRVTETLFNMEFERDSLQKLISAKELGRDSYKEMEIAIRSEQTARDLGISLYSVEGQAIRSFTGDIQRMQEELNKPIYRTWREGAIDALKEYGEAVRDLGSDIETAMSGAISGMEDAFVEFFTKGKMDFQSFVNAIQTDLARIAVRNLIMEPLTTGMQGLFSNMGGGLFGNGLFGGGSSGILGFADGGISTKPSLAMVSEGAYPSEAHIPLLDGRTVPLVATNSGYEVILPDGRSIPTSTINNETTIPSLTANHQIPTINNEYFMSRQNETTIPSLITNRQIPTINNEYFMSRQILNDDRIRSDEIIRNLNGATQNLLKNSFNSPIYSFADGGISTSPGLAFVSEGVHRAEAHVPLPDGRMIPVKINGGDNQTNSSIIINLYGTNNSNKITSGSEGDKLTTTQRQTIKNAGRLLVKY